MRISDWSSDVCSSDLKFRLVQRVGEHQRPEGGAAVDLRHSVPALEPGEEIAIGREEAVPQLLDLLDRPIAEPCQRRLGEPRRDADPQPSGDQLEQGAAPFPLAGVQPALHATPPRLPPTTRQAPDSPRPPPYTPGHGYRQPHPH